ncbi:MAG: hypothetical protein RL681_211 [Candidatus Parcubacteria bacterium]|jgi:hypothetical protein
MPARCGHIRKEDALNDDGLRRIHPKSSFTPDEEETYYRLQGKVNADGGLLPSERCWRRKEEGCSEWAPEIVLDRLSVVTPIVPEVLLMIYNGATEQFRGLWCFPGAWYKLALGNTIQEACSAIALREVGVDVTYLSVYPNPILWPPRDVDPLMAHPFGHPLSLFAKCIERAPIVPTDTLRFHRVDALPKNIVPVHEQFIVETFSPSEVLDVGDIPLLR